MVGVLYFTCSSMFWLDDVIVTAPLLRDVIQVSSLSLSSNYRVGCFCWTRGTIHGFLTSFSYFSHYFLILDFLHCHYLFVSLCHSWLHWNQIPFSCFLIPWALRGSVWYMRPHVSGTDCTVSLRARLSWDPGSRLSTGLFSHFHSLPKVSGVNVHWTIADYTFLVNEAVLILLRGWTQESRVT